MDPSASNATRSASGQLLDSCQLVERLSVPVALRATVDAALQEARGLSLR